MSGPERWLTAASRERPHHPALVTTKGVETYADLQHAAGRLAARLVGCGVRPRDRIAALLPNRPLFVHLVHAAQWLGATLVPLHLRLTRAELRPLLEDANPRLLICDAARAELARESAPEHTPVVTEAELDRLPAAPAARAERPDPDADQVVVFTSGTSAAPRGVRLSARALLAGARASAARLGVRADDRWLACMPLYHVGGLAILLRSALCATTVVLHETFDAHSVARALRDEPITLVSLVPSMLERVLEVAGPGGFTPTLRAVLLGGGPIRPELLERGLAAGVPLAPTYGLTEAGSQVATLAPGESGGPGCTGRPLPDTELRIADERGRPQPAGVAGEIRVRGPQLMSGYLNRPDATAQALAGGWLRTGDHGVLDAEGRLRVLDRRADLIVSGGENVVPSEVEDALRAHPDVADAAVVGRTDAMWGQRVHAVLVLRSGAQPREEDLSRWLRGRLAAFKLPRSFSFADALPRTASGKLAREALRRTEALRRADALRRAAD